MLSLKALHVEDFGPFKGTQTIHFPDSGVMIVYGDNMRGKTSLLNAIRFAFFGKVIGRGAKTTELNKIGNWESASEGKFGFSVQLEFLSGGHNYKLTRSCVPKVDQPAVDDDYLLEQFLERDGTVLGPEQLKAELTRTLPEQISRFFLFDGELLQEYEDLLNSESDMGRRISEAIERILGVPILTSARSTALRLKEQSELREATAAQNDQKTQEYGNQLQDIHAQREALKSDLQRLKSDLDELRARKAATEESLKRRERYAALLEKRDGLQRTLRELADRQGAKLDELKSAMGSAWCAVIGPQMQSLAADLTSRKTLLETEMTRWNVLRSLSSNDSDACPTCFRKITPDARGKIETALASFCDGDADSAARELDEIRRRLDAIQSYAQSGHNAALKVRWESLEEIRVDIATKSGEVTEISRQLQNVDEDELREEKLDFERTIKRIEVTEQSIAQCEISLAKNKVNAENIRKRLDKLGSADLRVQRSRRAMCDMIHELFDEAVSVYREQLRERVEADATRHFKALTTEAEYSALRINDSYGLTIMHADGSEIPVRSAGAEHVVALCLVGALQNNAPLQGPIIIDSPFGRLDRGHTENIVKALPDMAQQVMLLVYEDELPSGIARNALKGKLKSEWELERMSARHTELSLRKG